MEGSLEPEGKPRVDIPGPPHSRQAAAIEYPSATALRDAALALLDQLDRAGLQHVMLHGPNTHAPQPAAAWARVWFENPRLRARSAALSFHTWWSARKADYDAIRQVAQEYQKPVWATEIGLCARHERAACGGEAELDTTS